MINTIDTSRMHADDFVATTPAECCTEIGTENAYEAAAPEGFAIALIAVVAGILVLAMLVHVVVSYF